MPTATAAINGHHPRWSPNGRPTKHNIGRRLSVTYAGAYPRMAECGHRAVTHWNTAKEPQPSFWVVALLATPDNFPRRKSPSPGNPLHRIILYAQQPPPTGQLSVLPTTHNSLAWQPPTLYHPPCPTTPLTRKHQALDNHSQRTTPLTWK